MHVLTCWLEGTDLLTAKQKWMVFASTMSVLMENKFWFLSSVRPLIFWSLVGTSEFYPSARYGGGWMIRSKSDCGGRDAGELWMWWYMDTTDHKTVTKTNHLFSYWKKVSLLPILTAGYTLASYWEPSAVSQSWGRKATSPLPPHQPRVHFPPVPWRHVHFGHCFYPRWLI